MLAKAALAGLSDADAEAVIGRHATVGAAQVARHIVDEAGSEGRGEFGTAANAHKGTAPVVSEEAKVAGPLDSVALDVAADAAVPGPAEDVIAVRYDGRDGCKGDVERLCKAMLLTVVAGDVVAPAIYPDLRFCGDLDLCAPARVVEGACVVGFLAHHFGDGHEAETRDTPGVICGGDGRYGRDGRDTERRRARVSAGV